MKELIEDYKRRLSTAETMLTEFKSNGGEHDIRKDERLKTKASEYRTVIAELERAVSDDSHEKAINKMYELGLIKKVIPDENIAFVIYNTKTRMYLDKGEYFTDQIKNARTFTSKDEAERSMNYYVKIYSRTDRRGTCDNLFVLPVEIRISIKE